jgi:hypothetical protein
MILHGTGRQAMSLSQVQAHPPVQEEGKPVKRYFALLREGEEVRIGFVVTHIPIQDWCDANGYTLIAIRGERLAGPGERTKVL